MYRYIIRYSCWKIISHSQKSRIRLGFRLLKLHSSARIMQLHWRSILKGPARLVKTPRIQLKGESLHYIRQWRSSRPILLFFFEKKNCYKAPPERIVKALVLSITRTSCLSRSLRLEPTFFFLSVKQRSRDEIRFT